MPNHIQHLMMIAGKSELIEKSSRRSSPPRQEMAECYDRVHGEPYYDEEDE